MFRVNPYVGLVAVSFVVWAGTALAQVPPIVLCGWAVNVQCPGCSPSGPADATCGCGLNGTGCDCVKQTGGIQSGEIITCGSGTFKYNPDIEGYVLHALDPIACVTAERCRASDEAGGELNCSPLQEGTCINSGTCSWRISYQSVRTVYEQGLLCVPI